MRLPWPRRKKKEPLVIDWRAEINAIAPAVFLGPFVVETTIAPADTNVSLFLWYTEV